MKIQTKETKDSFTIDNYYEIDRNRVDEEGLDEWIDHLQKKVWWSPALQIKFKNWYENGQKETP